MKFTKLWRGAVLGVVLSTTLSTVPALCQTTLRLPKSVPLLPMRDPWPLAHGRWWDIDNNPFNAWITNGQPNGKFSYGNARVTLTFDRAPNVPYFVGRIQASGLKPNFCYQLKLLGKPQRGTRGWGALGDDTSNERIGYAARWWCDSSHATQTNFDDEHYLDFYKNAPANGNPVHDIYGYQFMGDFVTNRFGNADTAISGQYSYHITWASWQSGWRDVTFGTFPVQGGALPGGGFYAYGSTAPNDQVTLYYEYEAGRTNPVVLPGGLYKGRFVLTEETFHNSLGGGTNAPLGGFWKGVLASEDYNAQGRPDSNPDNDVTFTIGARRPAIGTMAPQAALDNPNVPREFAVPYSDADSDLHHAYLQIGDSRGQLQCFYNVTQGKLYLRNDADTLWLGGVAPGTAQTLSNSYGSLNCAATQVTNTPTGVIVRWNVSAAALWAGTTQPVLGFARDRLGLTQGWKSLGTWTIGGNQAPQNASLSPSNPASAAGAPRLLTSVHRDPNSSGNMRSVILHVGDVNSTPGAMRCLYDAVSHKLYLLDDAGETYLGGYAPGSDNVISNTQGSLDCAHSSVSLVGDTLTINWSLKPAVAWAGTSHELWLFTIDRGGAHTTWQELGSWAIQ